MKTMLVNPFYTKGPLPAHTRVTGQLTRRKSPFAGNPYLPPQGVMVVSGNPKRRRKSNPKRRRRNPMLPGTFSTNPMLPVRTNGRRKPRRRNPFELNTIVDNFIKGGVTGGGAYLLNKLLISGLGTTAGPNNTRVNTPNGLLVRQAARVFAAGAGSYLFGGSWGAAWVGANFYPFAFEMDAWWRSRQGGQGVSGAGSSASGKTSFETLEETSDSFADELEAALNGYDR